MKLSIANDTFVSRFSHIAVRAYCVIHLPRLTRGEDSTAVFRISALPAAQGQASQSELDKRRGRLWLRAIEPLQIHPDLVSCRHVWRTDRSDVHATQRHCSVLPSVEYRVRQCRMLRPHGAAVQLQHPGDETVRRSKPR